MKKILLFFLAITVAAGVMAQQNDYTIGYDGMGALKLGMSKAELEKLLNMKIVLKHIGVDGIYVETIQAKYKNIDMELSLFRSEDKVAILESVSTTNSLFKTTDGMGIGTDQSMIINKYEDQLLIIQPLWDYGPVAKKIPNTSTITLADIENLHQSIIFTIVNKKVTAIRVAPTPEFRDRE